MIRTIRYVTLFLVGFLSVLPLAAQQTFSIERFEQDLFDVTAQSKGSEKIDGSGDRYAIIKVTSTDPEDDLLAYQFNFGFMKSLVEAHGNQLWVYVQKNAKHVTVSREGYKTVYKHDLRMTLLPGKNYVMVLSPVSVSSSALQQQMVMFDIQPKDARAVVAVAREGGTEDLLGYQDETGAVAKSLPFGTYTYKVGSEMYKMSEGRFTLNDISQIHREQVVLSPNFSVVTLKVASGADIYVNGIRKGTGSWTGRLKAGAYQVECRQASHHSVIQSINVPVDQEVSFDLFAPEPIVGVLMVTSTPLGADIFIDGVNKGKTPMNVVDVLVGKHELFLKKEGYLSGMESVEVEENTISTAHLDLNKEEDLSYSESVVVEENTVWNGDQGTQENDTSSASDAFAEENSFSDENLDWEDDFTVSQSQNDRWVDLGLSVLWANMNVGAHAPEEYGDYFAWGETSPKEDYTAVNSVTFNKLWQDISGDDSYDAAAANWGAPARMPTKEELRELVENTTTQWTTFRGVSGRLVTSKINGNSIFFPAAGIRYGTSLYNAGEDGDYWSSTPGETLNSKAYNLDMDGQSFDSDRDNRDFGQSVRPVCNR